MKPESKEAPINIRAKASQRDLIDMAANLVAKSRTDFMLDAACREAQDILLDQRLFIVDDEHTMRFWLPWTPPSLLSVRPKLTR